MRSKTPVIKLVYWFAWTTLIFGDKVLSLGLRHTKFFHCLENLSKYHYHTCVYNILFSKSSGLLKNISYRWNLIISCVANYLFKTSLRIGLVVWYMIYVLSETEMLPCSKQQILFTLQLTWHEHGVPNIHQSYNMTRVFRTWVCYL